MGKRIAIVGGGYLGAELAKAIRVSAQRMRVRVNILHARA